jgi:hypothetical protein
VLKSGFAGTRKAHLRYDTFLNFLAPAHVSQGGTLAFVTTLLILIVSFLVFALVVVAFVYMIMPDKDKENDEERLTQSLIMTLKIFLDDKSFHCLKQSIPPDSRSQWVLNEKTVQFKNVGGSLFGSNIVIVISCDEAEARDLLLYAGRCPGVVASIHEAFRSAGLPLD